MKTGIIIGTRSSRLALVQTESVVARIKEINPHLEVRLSKIVTAGDRDRRTPLDRMGVAVFVKELERALLDCRTDLAVHSLKDMPVEVPPGLRLLAVMPRLDPRDVLVAKSNLGGLAPGSRIGTGSLRRAVQLNNYRPDLEVCSIRGNVDTRLRKVAAGEVDGVIVAAAAMIRLKLEEKITEYLPLENFLPAAGQGVLALEVRSDDKETAGLVASLNHDDTWRAVTAERAFLRAVGGGCRAPVGVLGTVSGPVLKLAAMVAGHGNRKILCAAVEGDAAVPEEVGRRMAQEMFARGAVDLVGETGSR